MMSNKFLGTSILLLSLILLCAARGQAQVTVDSRSANGVQDILTTSTLTWQHTVNSCSNCILYVGVSTYTTVTVPTARVLSVTYGAQTLTAVGSQVSPAPTLPATGNSAIELFRLIAPPAGTNTVTVSFVGLAQVSTINYAFGGAISLNGANQNPTGANTAFSSTSGNSAFPTFSLSGGVIGDLALDLVGTSPNGGNLVQRSGQTVCTDENDETTCLRGRRFFNGSIDVGASGVKPGATGAIPINWESTLAASWALGGIIVKQNVVSASPASIGGQIKTVNEKPLANVSVALQNLETGEIFYAVSDENGFYNFADLALTKLYRVEAYSKLYNFSPDSQMINLYESLEAVNFYGSPRSRKNKFVIPPKIK